MKNLLKCLKRSLLEGVYVIIEHSPTNQVSNLNENFSNEAHDENFIRKIFIGVVVTY